MNKANKSNFKEYLATIFVSLFMVSAIALVVELELLYRSEKTVNFAELNTKNLSKFYTIEELEKQLAKTPDDIILNIRLAKSYEEIDKLDKANDFYKNALKLSGRSNFAIYSYALFCAKQDLFVFAATLAEELSGNSKRVNLFKAKIYENIADGLSEAKNYPASTKSYQIVYKYAKSIGDIKYLNQIKEKYSKEYVKLADYNMELGEVELAISNLNNSLKIKKNALANYKLGLIYLESNPKKAEKHINQAFFEDVYVVNPYIYNNLLQSLLEETKVLSNDGLFNYYNSRLTRFKNKIASSYLYKNDIIIDNSSLITKKTWFKKLNHYLFFDIKNNTKEEINDLFVKAELYIDSSKYIFEKKIIKPTSPLDAYDVLQYSDFELPKEIEFDSIKNSNDVFVRYFAKKQEDAPWILIKIDFLNI
ncbi:MAG: hypothetical protein IJB79_06070 [Candidatus Gastranaerophilales bacterium]|nr:hypothetical protein [Candidatus Gastranaerophilales bacterium]